MKVKDKRTGAVLKYTPPDEPIDDLSATEFVELFFKLYEKVSYVNNLSVVVHGGMGGNSLLTLRILKND